MFNNDSFPSDPETVEYKNYMPTKLELARDIAAFANTKGGRIFIGYIPNDNRTWIEPFFGVSNLSLIREAIKKAEAALPLLHPVPLNDIVEGKSEDDENLYVLVDVAKSPTPVIFEDNCYYVRRGNKTTLAEEELIDALSESIPSIKQNIINSLESEDSPKSAVHSGSGDINTWGVVASDSNFRNLIHGKIEEKPHLDLKELLSDSITRTREDLTTQRKERLQQARITFIVALVVLVLAILLVFVGVILIFTNKVQEGIVSSVASIVSGIVSGLALAFNKQVNDRMDEYARELVVLEKSYTGMQYISLIADVKIKDEAILDLAKGISTRDKTGS